MNVIRMLDEDLSSLPDELSDIIHHKLGLDGARTAIQAGIIHPSVINMSKLLEDRFLTFQPFPSDEKFREIHVDGETFFSFGRIRRLREFIKKFGDQVRKISIDYGVEFIDDANIEFLCDILPKCTQSLEELRIKGGGYLSFWVKLAQEDGFHFPKVKKLHLSYPGFNIKSFFPKIESFVSNAGPLRDLECFADLTTLNDLELSLMPEAEYELVPIFANNKNIKRLTIKSKLNRTETMAAMAKNLKELETLHLMFPGRNFMLRQNDRALYEFPSVKYLNIESIYLSGICGEPSFCMPRLERLSITAEYFDKDIIRLTRYCRELKSVQITMKGGYYIEVIKTTFKEPTWKLSYENHYKANNRPVATFIYER